MRVFAGKSAGALKFTRGLPVPITSSRLGRFLDRRSRVSIAPGDAILCLENGEVLLPWPTRDCLSMLRERKIVFGLLETHQSLESKKRLKTYYPRNLLHSMLNERYVFDSLWRLRPQYKPETKKMFVELVFLALPAGLQEIGSNRVRECHLGTKIFP